MNRLATSLAKVCKEHLLTEKWLLAPSLRVGHQWVETVARHGQPVVNLHVKTVKSLAIELAGSHMASKGLALASARAGDFLFDRAFRSLRGKLRYLSELQPSDRLAKTIRSAIDAVRLAGLSSDSLGKDHFEVPLKGADLLALYTEYRVLLRDEQLVDYADVIELAIARLSTDPEASDSATRVLVADDLECAELETRLLDRISRTNLIALPVDPFEAARLALQPAGRTGSVPEPGNPAEESPICPIKIARAVGEVNEVRGALRSCLAEGVAWDGVEILHTDTDTYAGLFYETLRRSGPARLSKRRICRSRLLRAFPAAMRAQGVRYCCGCSGSRKVSLNPFCFS